MKKTTMKGGVKRRGKRSWRLFLWWKIDPVTKKRKPVTQTFRGSHKQAVIERSKLIAARERKEYVHPTNLTVGQHLHHWVDTAIKPPAKRWKTYLVYKHIIDKVLIPAFGDTKLQALDPADLTRFYIEQTEDKAPATVRTYHIVLHSALKSAVKRNLIVKNVASGVDGVPRVERVRTDDPDADDQQQAEMRVWNVEQARRFLVAAKEAGTQWGAFYRFCLDTGCRKSEACGLRWRDVDLAAGRVTIRHQLVLPGQNGPFEFGPTKGGRARKLDLSAETVVLLRSHHKAQAELRMRNRDRYNDHDLVFSRQWEDLTQSKHTLGMPLQANNIGQRSFARIIKAADVPVIRFHDMRHTCATLMLLNGEPMHVVQRRLGHKKIEITMNLYAHVLPEQAQGAADRLGELLG